MITVGQLKMKFPVRDVRPYGECIIIPGAEFDPDWEYFLGEQGYKCFMTDLDRKPVTLVKLGTVSKADSQKEVYTSEPKKRKPPVSPWQDPERRWKPEEDELIIALWNQRQDTLQIHAELRKRFPNRTKDAVKCRVTRLIKAGKISGRWHKGEHKKKPEKIRRAGSEPATSPAPVHTPAHTLVPVINTTLTIQLSVNCNDRNAVANLLEVIEKMGLTKKEASAWRELV